MADEPLPSALSERDHQPRSPSGWLAKRSRPGSALHESSCQTTEISRRASSASTSTP